MKVIYNKRIIDLAFFGDTKVNDFTKRNTPLRTYYLIAKTFSSDIIRLIFISKNITSVCRTSIILHRYKIYISKSLFKWKISFRLPSQTLPVYTPKRRSRLLKQKTNFYTIKLHCDKWKFIR